MKSFDLGKDKPFGLILRLAIPAMLGQLVNVLYGIVDRIFIGQIDNIGSLALAGVGVCAPVTTLLTSFSYLIGVGGAPLLSMSLGANDKGRQYLRKSDFLYASKFNQIEEAYRQMEYKATCLYSLALPEHLRADFRKRELEAPIFL